MFVPQSSLEGHPTTKTLVPTLVIAVLILDETDGTRSSAQTKDTRRAHCLPFLLSLFLVVVGCVVVSFLFFFFFSPCPPVLDLTSGAYIRPDAQPLLRRLHPDTFPCKNHLTCF